MHHAALYNTPLFHFLQLISDSLQQKRISFAITGSKYKPHISILRESVRERERETETEGGGGGGGGSVSYCCYFNTVVSYRHPPDQLLCLQSRFQEDVPGNQVPCRASKQVSDATPLTMTTPQTLSSGWHPHALVNVFPTGSRSLTAQIGALTA